MINQPEAVNFLQSHASPLELARLAWLLERKRPGGKIAALLFAGQRPDGGWPAPWSGVISSLDATCYRLAQAESLRLLFDQPAVEAAARFLADRQGPDGGWEEDPKLAGAAPTWVQPGMLEAKLYLTANCGFWLAALGDPALRATRAADFLTARIDPDGRLPGYLQTHWLAAGMLFRLGRDDQAAPLLRYLESRVDELDPGSLGWVLTALAAGGAPPELPLVQQAATRLAGLPNPDGSWGDPREASHVTLEALRGLRFAGLD